MKYLAIGFWVDTTDCIATCSLSRETDSCDAQEVLKMLCDISKMDSDAIDIILLIHNNPDQNGAPKVFASWSAENGDFDDE